MAITTGDKLSDLKIEQEKRKTEAALYENDLLKSLLIGATKPGQSPGDDKTGDNRHDKDWPPPAPLKPKLAHGEGRGPQPKYHDEYNRELPIPPWMQMFPDGKVREIPWMKEKYLQEHPELRLQISGIPSSKHIRDRLKPFTKGGPYDDKGGSLRGIPDALRIQLLRDAMA